MPITPDTVDFSMKPADHRLKIVLAMIDACTEMWGEQCMPGADIGDNEVYAMTDVRNYVEQALSYFNHC